MRRIVFIPQPPRASSSFSSLLFQQPRMFDAREFIGCDRAKSAVHLDPCIILGRSINQDGAFLTIIKYFPRESQIVPTTVLKATAGSGRARVQGALNLCQAE